MDRQLSLQAIDLVIRVGALAMAVWFSRSAFLSLKYGFFYYDAQIATRSKDPGVFWTIVVMWAAVATCCGWIALAGL